MSQEPNLFPSNASSGSANSTGAPAPDSRHRTPVWIQRFELFLRVVVRLYVGVLVLLLPWTHLWGENHFLNYYPWLASFAVHGAVRGIVSGIGLLNLWIAITDAIHYRES